ncbi:MAG: zinc ABC transporter substrate-binding protein [Candidatus Micrarchaeota archaeon]
MEKIALLSVMLLLSMLSGCTGHEEPSEQQEKMKVVVTIMPQAEFVENVGGEKVDVIVMIPSGASPHTYEPTPSQLTEVAAAGLYFKVGSGVEFENAWMADIEGVNPSMKIIDCSRGITLIEMENGHDEHEGDAQGAEEQEHAHTGLDPHIWNSPKNAIVMVQNIYEALVAEDPENAAYYKANADYYMARLDALDSSILATLENKTDGEFIVFHPAWGYFAHEYGLEQVAMEEAGKEPTAQNLQRIIDEADEHGIKVIFASPQFSADSARTVAGQIGGSVVLIDPLDKDYLRNMQQIANAFASSME